MLAADRRALNDTVKKQSLDIYSRELDFFTRSSLAVSTASSFIVGFAWTGIVNFYFFILYIYLLLLTYKKIYIYIYKSLILHFLIDIVMLLECFM